MLLKRGLRELEALAKRDPLKAEEEIQAFMERISEESHEPSAGTPLSRIGGRQFEFFRKMLQNNGDADWTFAVMHRPLWKTDDSNYTRFEEMLTGRKNCTVVAGHLHNLEFTRLRGIDRIQMGRTGACKHRSGIGNDHHFLHVSLQNGKPVINAVRLDE